MADGEPVWYWVPDEKLVYSAGLRVSPSSEDTLSLRIGSHVTTVKADKCHLLVDTNIAQLEDAAKVDDLSKMIDIFSGSILHVLRGRFGRDDIYTRLGQILIALNPFKQISGK